MINQTERRTFTNGVEYRQADSGDVAFGYAALFEKRTHSLPGFVEEVRSGAFSKTVQEADVRALFNHDPSALLGRTGAGSLRLSQDERGLAYEIDLPDTTLGRDVRELLRRGDLSGSSFGFIAVDVEWGRTEDGYPLRSINEAKLIDVGPVTFPAYSEAPAALRSLAARGYDLDQLVAAAEQDELADFLQSEDERNVADLKSPQRFYRRLAL